MGTPQLIPLRMPPGVFRSGTERQARGRWYDTDKVRWYDQVVLGPILGWLTKSLTPVTGKARAILTWKDNTGDSGRGSRWAIIGTHSGLYIMDDGGVVKDITPVGFTSGRADATVLLGYGEGKYGFWAYGTPRPDTGNVLPATVWDLDIWGQYPIGCSHDDGTTGGSIYMWQLDFATPTKAAAITNAPTSCYGVVVAPQRFIMALGAGGNPRKLQWCDQGAETVWTPSATNQAGSLEIPSGKLICGRAVGDQVLLLSDIEAHVCDYVGLPFVFSRRKVGDKCGAISKRCIVASGPMAAWWSRSGFWIYDGVCRPLPCELWDDLLRNLTVAQQSKISAMWDKLLGTDANCSANIASGATNSGGILQVKSGTDAGGTMALNGAQIVGVRMWKAASQVMSIEFQLRVTDITNVCAFWGLTDEQAALEMPFTLAAGNVLTSNASDAVGFLFDTAADTDNVWLVGVAGDVDATKQDTGAAPTTGAAQRWRIDITSAGAATFFRDDVQIGSAMAGACGVNAVMGAAVCLFSRNNVQKRIDVRYFYGERDV